MNRSRIPRTLMTVFATAATLFGVARGQAQPMDALLNTASEGAEIVVAVPSMSGLSQKLADFSSATGIDTLAPEMSDALGALKQEMGWAEGLDDDGPMLLVVDGITEAIQAEFNDTPEQPAPQFVMLVPVSDYDTFVKQFGGDPAVDGTALVFPRGDDGFGKQLDGYAVLGDTRETVAAYTAGGRGRAMIDALGEMVGAHLPTSDALIYVDVAAMAPALELAIKESVKEMRGQMERQGQSMPASWGGMMDSFADAYQDVALTFVQGTNKYLVTAELDDAGVAFTGAIKLKAGTELASYFKPTDQQGDGSAVPGLLASLPESPYIFAGGFDADAFNVDKLVEKLNATFTGADGNAGMMTPALESMRILTQIDGYGSVFYTPEPAAMMTGGFFTSLTVYDVDDSAAFVAAQKAYLEKLKTTTITLPATQAGGNPGSMTFNTEFVEKDLVIDGVDIHRFQVNTVLPPEMMQQFGPMAAVMGNAGSGGYMAIKDGKVLVTTVTDPQLITRGLKAVGEDTGLGSGGAIAKLRKDALPANATVELYVSLDGIARTANPFMIMTPLGRPITIPDNLPPIATGLSTDGQGVGVRTYVPTALVKFGIDTYLDFAPPAQDGPQRDGPPRAPRAY
ncbi:MAG: hypothetical protein AAF333_18520 [Planctomycetota bacterium]